MIKPYRYSTSVLFFLCMAAALTSCVSHPLAGAMTPEKDGQATALRPSLALATPPAPTLNAPLITPGNPIPTVVPQGSTPDPEEGLLNDKRLADQEMQAACRSETLSEVKNHAEAVVNIISGPWGLWYGDGNGDGVINDPSDRQGILPAGIVQSSANTDNAHLQLGWAMILYEEGSSQDKSQVDVLLGDVRLWKNDPTDAWSDVSMAVDGTTPDHDLIIKVPGEIVKEMAWARMVLIKANILQDARQFACRGSQ